MRVPTTIARMSNNFEFLGYTKRPTKPRETGLTMMIDWGLGIQRQKDILDLCSDYVDSAKFAVGTAGLMKNEKAKEKIRIYTDHQVSSFIGGQFLEYGIHNKGLQVADTYFEQVRGLGFDLVEISDNTLEIEPKDKYGLIRKAIQTYGLRVYGEVGSKRESSSIDALLDGIRGCLDAGASRVFVEAAELVDQQAGELLLDRVKAITDKVDINSLMLELPGIWIKGVRESDVHQLAVHLIKNFGAEVNIANVMPDWILELETLRTGIGVSGV